tara:strand:+ start:1497 stop:1748 length:252 start_codon:yes stop_codon:yes gene_type:complete
MEDLTAYEKTQLLEVGYIYDPISKLVEHDPDLPNIINIIIKRDARVIIDCDDCGFDKGNLIEDKIIANCDRCGKINDMMFGGC